jgi:hypothetical protein
MTQVITRQSYKSERADLVRHSHVSFIAVLPLMQTAKSWIPSTYLCNPVVIRLIAKMEPRLLPIHALAARRITMSLGIAAIHRAEDA